MWLRLPIRSYSSRPMNEGLEMYLSAAIVIKHVPVTVVTDRAQADLTLEGFAESESTKQTRITMRLIP